MLAHSGEHGIQILLDNGSVLSKLKLFFKSAKRALQILLTNVELKVSSATFAGKHAGLTTINLVARFCISHKVWYPGLRMIDQMAGRKTRPLLTPETRFPHLRE